MMNNTYKEVDKIYETKDYSIFNKLHGNRKTKKSNIKTLTQSMNDSKWVGSPVVVNEKMEIIDGQNRIEAAIAAKIPVKFMTKPSDSDLLFDLDAAKVCGITIPEDYLKQATYIIENGKLTKKE